MFIRTERLFLRPGWPEDVEELAAAIGNEAAIVSTGFSRQASKQAFLREFFARPQSRLLPHFLIHLRTGNGPVLIGGISLTASGHHVRLNYWLARKYSGQGYATEALRAVLAEARMLGHREVIAEQADESDTISRMLERAGFKPVDERRSRDFIEGPVPARVHVAILTDKLFDLLGVGSQPSPRPA